MNSPSTILPPVHPTALDSGEGTPVSAPPAVPTELVDEIVQAVAARLDGERRLRATYRVQFNREFTFRQATGLVPYWAALGISDVYASPYLKAVTGSVSGYDIVDHSRLNPELGTEEDFSAFVAALDVHGMGHILDFVPNHMGVGTDENAWWQDVLENGPSSRYASYFDIDWDPLKPDLQSKVLLPVLGEQFGAVLENGSLTVGYQDGAFFVRYGNRRFPIAPKSSQQILRHRLDELIAKMPAEDPPLLEYQSILTALTHLPPRTETDPVKLDERHREKEVVKRRLARVCDESPALRDWIEENVAIFNGRVEDPRSFDLLEHLLDEQAYRLSFWRVAADEINYRRFFDVNELAAICMERPEVFEASHAFVFRLLEQGQLEGLRIDHADGLYDPTSYLQQLQQRRFLQLCRAEFERRSGSSPGAAQNGTGSPRSSGWPEFEAAFKDRQSALRQTTPGSRVACPLYLLVEKILEGNERLPSNWPVHGSTGYDFVNHANGLFVARENAKAFDAIYTRFIGEKADFGEMVYDAKRLILRASMSSELNVLGHALDRISERNRWTRDFTRHGLVQALREVIASFPVYRTYTDGGAVLERDRRYVEQAIARARHRNPAINRAVFDFVRDVLLLKESETLSDEERAQRQAFVGRFQQLTGPMMAKAVEDTTFYRFNRLVSLNEVGGDPQRFGLTVAEFHQQNLERQAQRPCAMLATSTHDTKRAEDVRARIDVLSELPEEWKRRVFLWTRWNKRKKTKLESGLAPDRADEYLLYQTLIGTWPFDPPHGATLKAYVTRIQEYMLKAVREAKLFSSWVAPNEGYERAMLDFIEAILWDDPTTAFRSDFEPFARRIAECGMWNSLAQLLLKLTSPGIPDIYQGTEFWDFSLVDPDNRRPVDYDRRIRLLQELSAATRDRATLAADLLANATDSRIKLFTLHQALEFRKQSPDLFTSGAYLPLETSGDHGDRLCAFLRRTETDAALVIVPRLVAALYETVSSPPIGAAWGDTRLALPTDLASQSWQNRLTGERIESGPNGSLAVNDLLRIFPVGLFEAAG